MLMSFVRPAPANKDPQLLEWIANRSRMCVDMSRQQSVSISFDTWTTYQEFAKRPRNGDALNALMSLVDSFFNTNSVLPLPGKFIASPAQQLLPPLTAFAFTGVPAIATADPSTGLSPKPATASAPATAAPRAPTPFVAPSLNQTAAPLVPSFCAQPSAPATMFQTADDDTVPRDANTDVVMTESTSTQMKKFNKVVLFKHRKVNDDLVSARMVSNVEVVVDVYLLWRESGWVVVIWEADIHDHSSTSIKPVLVFRKNDLIRICHVLFLQFPSCNCRCYHPVPVLHPLPHPPHDQSLYTELVFFFESILDTHHEREYLFIANQDGKSILSPCPLSVRSWLDISCKLADVLHLYQKLFVPASPSRNIVLQGCHLG